MIKRTPKYLAITIVSLVALAGADGVVHAESATYQAEVGPSISITMPSNLISVFVDPSNQPFNSADFSISVSTNNSTGYYMTMSSEITDLVKITDTTKTLPTLSTNEGGYTEETFEANKWGYKIGSANYIPFVSGAKIAEADTIINNDITNLTFATKVDYLQSSGIYQGILDFFAVANPTVMAIQNLDAAYCTEDPLVVMDARDGEEYTIQKLADGNCWMLDNLRLDPTEVSLAALKGRTNATNESLTYFKNGVSSAWTSHSQDSYTLPYIATGNANIVASDARGIGSGKIGVYYNYCAASAGTYCGTTISDGENITEDICPSGWRLPRGGTTSTSTNEFNNLYIAYNSDDDTFRTSLSVALGGGNFSGGQSNTDLPSVALWSSTSKGNDFMYSLGVTADSIGTDAASIPRFVGNVVRCIMEPTIASARYLQDITPEMIDNTAIGVTAIVKDKRDNEAYKIGKLIDGSVWMLDNLRLDPTEVSLESLKGNTNAPDEALTYFKEGGGSSPYATDAVASGTGMPERYTAGQVNIEYKDTEVANLVGDRLSKIGVYYNYCAASAGTVCPDTNLNYDNAQYDICPAGWRLPASSNWYSRNSGSNEFQNLFDAYDSDLDKLSSALNAAKSGGFYSTNVNPISSGQALFWASTIETTNSMHVGILDKTYNTMQPSGSYARSTGWPIRCKIKTQ